MARFIVVVLDGFGIGEMPDVPSVRPQDIGSHTAAKLLNHFPLKSLPVLEKLGLINLVSNTQSVMVKNDNANTGVAELAHEGGDTFMGHQEIMGTRPESPLVKPFQESIDDIETALKENHIVVRRHTVQGLSVLVVEESLVIGDNLEADLGQVYNMCANFEAIAFEHVKTIADIVRSANPVGRNIAFGGHIGTTERILSALEVKPDQSGKPAYIGTNTPDTGVYENGFQVVHLGYGVNHLTQIPHLLNQVDVKTYLYGKVADIVRNDEGVSYKSLVDTDTLFSLLHKDLSEQKHGFFCLNVQETDLSGHQQDPKRYWNVLERSDLGLGQVVEMLEENDVLLVMADHGNDPFIGHTKHTREQVPLMVFKHGLNGVEIGRRETMSDVGATVADFFNSAKPENGTSFLDKLS